LQVSCSGLAPSAWTQTALATFLKVSETRLSRSRFSPATISVFLDRISCVHS